MPGALSDSHGGEWVTLRRNQLGGQLMKFIRKAIVGSAIGLLSLSLATPAAAQDCWNGAAVKAAKVRDLQTLLMVGALQCRTSQYDVLANYNKFVKAHRVVISAHNDVLKSHFIRAKNARGYDKFTTALANGRSIDAINPGFCKETAALAEQLVRASPAEVEAMAERLVAMPKGVGRTCS